MPDNIESTPSDPNINSSPVSGKTVPIRKPRKKPVPKKQDATVLTERRLLDSKIIMPESHHRLAKAVLYAMILGGLTGAAILFYLNTRTTSPDDYSAPTITIPDDTASPPPPATTTPTTTAAEPTPPAGVQPAAPVQVVEILSTPTNFLNVRKGPGTNFAKIGEVKPGEAYILISTNETKGWYEIRLANGSTGGVTRQYAKVK